MPPWILLKVFSSITRIYLFSPIVQVSGSMLLYVHRNYKAY